MTGLSSVQFFSLLTVFLVTGGCTEDTPPDPMEAERGYGAPVSETDAVPVPAIAAEPDRYVGHTVTADGRIVRVSNSGCTLVLDGEGQPSLRIDAVRTETECAWKLPRDARGFAVATGTLRRTEDTLHMSTRGVELTPMRLPDGDE